MDKGDVVDGRYRLEEPLGEGAFGETWRARDQRLDRLVVIKLGRWQSRERLVREFQAAASLHSDHIQKAYEFGRTADGRVYLVYEWIDGATLDTLLATTSKLPVDEALAVAAAVARGLETAHAVGLVHRDIKPSNVLIPRTGGFAAAKLLDFGLVGYLTQQAGERLQTLDGAIMGTPRYMSPEQIRGEPQAAASDVWSLGVMLAEMVAGRYPFRDGADMGSLVTAILRDEPDLSAIPVQPTALRTFIEWCVNKDLARRPSDGRAVRRALDEIVAGQDSLRATEEARAAAEQEAVLRAWSEQRVALEGRLRVDSVKLMARMRVNEPENARLAAEMELRRHEAARVHPSRLRFSAAKAFVARRSEAVLTLTFLVATSTALTVLPLDGGDTPTRTAALSLSTIAMGILAGRLLRVWARQIDATTPAMVVARTRSRLEAGRLLSESMALDVRGLEEWATVRGSPREREQLAMALHRYQESLTEKGFSGLTAALENLVGCVDQIRPWWVRSSAQFATLITVGVVGLGLVIAARAMWTFH